MHYTSRETYESISQQTNDPIVERKTCRVSGQPFPITQKDVEFYDKISPTFNGKKYPIPTPTLCPEERARRRFAFRNERKLYRRKCDFSGKEIISIYSPDKSLKVYDKHLWWSDQRSPLDYGRAYDFNQSFSENFRKLFMEIPWVALSNDNCVNSDYCNYSWEMKNCYLCHASRSVEDCMYSERIFTNTNNCIDVSDSSLLEHCYQCVNCDNCYGSNYLLDCGHCNNSNYLIDCHWCSSCSFCTGLANKKYCYQNQQLNKEEYEEKIKDLPQMLYAGREGFEKKGVDTQAHRNLMIIRSENCVGHRISDSSNCVLCYNIEQAQDCKYLNNGSGPAYSDVYDGYGIGATQSLGYEGIDTGAKSYRTICTLTSHGNTNIYYVFACYNCSDCFGCIGLRNQQYCIFNKQYEKADYERLTSQIVEQMQKTGERGEFFHPALSPFGYNETVAQEYYPSTFEQARSQGYNRSTYEAPAPTAENIIQGKDLPVTVEEVSDDILKSVIACEVTGRPFRIEAKELTFYRKHHLPLPRKHPDQRYAERFALRRLEEKRKP